LCNLPRIARNGFNDLMLHLEMIGLIEYQETRGRFQILAVRTDPL